MKKSIICLLLLAGFIAQSETRNSHPNILLIISDDQGYSDLGFMGNPILRMPQIDELVYVVETIDNLVSNVWKSVALMDTNASGYAAGFDAITNHIPTIGKTNEFIRLKIESE